MTLVVARRFGQGVIILADTMLTDDGGVTRGLRLGQIKIVPVADRVTVAYAGQVTTALDLIRSARKEFKMGTSVKDVIADLAEGTRDDRCEFIVCSHQSDVLLAKLREGHIARGSDRYTLGDAAPLTRLPDVSAYDPNGKLEEHIRFRVSMLELFLNEGHNVASTVGGFLVDRGCTPAGHKYFDHHATTTWDTTEFPPGVTPDQAADRASGGTMFSYNCLVPAGVDAGVLGYLPQPRIGIVYAPLLQDHAVVLRDVDYGTAAAEVARMAEIVEK